MDPSRPSREELEALRRQFEQARSFEDDDEFIPNIPDAPDPIRIGPSSVQPNRAPRAQTMGQNSLSARPSNRPAAAFDLPLNATSQVSRATTLQANPVNTPLTRATHRSNAPWAPPGVVSNRQPQGPRTNTDAVRNGPELLPAQQPNLQVITDQIQSIQAASGVRPQVFVPSHNVLEAEAGAAGENTATAGEIPDGDPINLHENCGLWITNIAPTVSYATLFDKIFEGKVYVLLIDPPNEQFETKAAKLVFFHRPAAVAFKRRGQDGGIVIHGLPIMVGWNRRLYAPYDYFHVDDSPSRVIQITGPENLMSFEYFEAFFRSKFEYQLDRRLEVACGREGMKIHEWRFARVQAQSESAKLAIDRELTGVFSVKYAADPCDRSPRAGECNSQIQ